MTQADTKSTFSIFEPTIIVFACNWCSYAGADLAGVSRLKYPSNIRIVRVMCYGRVDPAFILKAFINGADGVLVAGCHPGDCHYLEVNLRAEERINNTIEALKTLGWEADRLHRRCRNPAGHHRIDPPHHDRQLPRSLPRDARGNTRGDPSGTR